jgi:hypothetical protein
VIGPLPVKLSLNRLKQRSIEDGWLLARKDLTLVSDLANIEAVAQKSGKRSPGERDVSLENSSSHFEVQVRSC